MVDKVQFPASHRAWDEALAKPGFKKALDEGLADVAAGRTKPWSEIAASYDPRPGDEARYENAIARRNAAILAYREAEALLTAARLRGYTDLRDWIGNLNETQHELEWAHRDLIRARVRFQADTAVCRFCKRREPIVRGTYTRIQFADGISLVCDTCSSRADGAD